MLRIYIPTLGRVERQRTLNNLPFELHTSVTLVCVKAEAKELAKAHPTVKVVVCPAELAKRIASKRDFIVHHARTTGGGKILMLDDDLEFHARCAVANRVYNGDQWHAAKGHTNLNKANAKDSVIIIRLKRLDRLLDQHPHGGLGSRLLNNYIKEEETLNGRVCHALAYNLDVLPVTKVRFADVFYREDFHMTLFFLTRGYSNVVLNNLVSSPGTYGAEGGCSAERTVDLSDEAALKLAQMYPGLVRVVDREYDNVPRKEVVVSWKRAYNASV